MFYQNCSKIPFYNLKSNFVTFLLQETRYYPYFFFQNLIKIHNIIIFCFFWEKTLTFRIYFSTSCFIRIVQKFDFTTSNPILLQFSGKKIKFTLSNLDDIVGVARGGDFVPTYHHPF